MEHYIVSKNSVFESDVLVWTNVATIPNIYIYIYKWCMKEFIIELGSCDHGEQEVPSSVISELEDLESLRVQARSTHV